MEFTHDVDRTTATKYAWSGDIGDVFDLLDAFGWDVRAQAFFDAMDACRLIVNVYKHGQGSALRQLDKKYPMYLPEPLGGLVPSMRPKHVNHDWLAVNEEAFAMLAKGLREFWEAFPDGLKLA